MAYKKPVQAKPQKERMTVAELEKAAAAEPEKIMTAFEERAKNEEARLQDATDSDFWFSICFQTREQKEEFLQKMGLLQLGDKYLDGLKVAKALGVKLETPVPPNRKIQKFGGGYLKRIIP